MYFIKSTIQHLLARFGYRLAKLDPTATHDGKRIVINAFYKGRCFRCFKGDVITDYILTGRGFEKQLDSIIAGLDRQGAHHVIEIGANIGTSFIPIASDFPYLQFHCVEPVQEFFQLLQINAQTFECSNVTLYQRAMSAHPNEALKIHTILGTAGAVKRFDGYKGDTISTNATTIDQLFGHLSIALLKIDVDGFELQVLRGASNILHSQRPKIFMEFDTRIMQRAGYRPQDLTDLLAAFGYDTVHIWDNLDQFITVTSSFAELTRIASGLPFHANILLEARKTKI